MPIEHRIDCERRRVVVRLVGVVTAEEMFAYQRDVWSSSEIVGFDELIDMTETERFVKPTPDQVGRLARIAASMDTGVPSKIAMVAPSDLTYGLGREYQALRTAESSEKQVGVFRTLDEALAFLGDAGRTL